MSTTLQATKAPPAPAALARAAGMVLLLALGALPAASALAGTEAGGLVLTWRALREGAAAAVGYMIHAPAWVDAACAFGLAMLAASCDGYARGGVSMLRGLAHGWRVANRVSAPRTGPAQPVTGAGQAALAIGYFFASALVGALIVSQVIALIIAFVVSTFQPDFNQAGYLLISATLALIFTLIGLRWSLISVVGGALLFPLYAVLALGLRGWRVLAAAALAAAVAAAALAFLSA